ncbi:MAG: hypothetical protein AAFR82_08445 [Pseudomonadota bacterium]
MTFRFNDELLLSQEDRALAQKSYPNIFFALDHPELRAEFERIDGRAMKAKRTSRWIGCAALVFATLSLLTFPSEPLIKGIWKSSLEYEIVFQYMAILGAGFGILALVFGNIGLGFGKVKRNWLQLRLITERLRQWHSQYLIAHAAEIAAIAHETRDQADWLAKRSLAFQRFKRSFIDQIGSEFAKYTRASAAAFSGQSITDPKAKIAFWIDESWAKTAAQKPDKTHQTCLDEVYRAYEETRLTGQIQYTNYVLSADGAFWSSPAKQLHVLGNLSYVLVIMAFIANLVALASAVWSGFPIDWPVLSSLAIAFAIVAVGVRALLEGLRPQRETRRMQFYAAAISHADEAFKAARTHAKRIEAMSLLERASYDEMIEFMGSNERARFVL